jgi:hypothetical protein
MHIYYLALPDPSLLIGETRIGRSHAGNSKRNFDRYSTFLVLALAMAFAIQRRKATIGASGF